MESRKCYGPIHKGILIDLNLFGINQKVCRMCKSEYARIRYQAKKSDIIVKVKAYKAANKYKIKAYNEDYRKENPYVMPLRDRLWADLKRLVGRTLKPFGYNFKSLEDLIGMNKIQFLSHIEGQLSRGMHSGNYGSKPLQWTIRNRLGIGSRDLSTRDSQKLFFNYSNLIPGWFKKNIQQKIPFPNEKRILDNEPGYSSAA